MDSYGPPGGSYGGAPYTPAGYTSYAPGGAYGPAYGAQSYAPATPMYSSGYGAPAYGYAGGGYGGGYAGGYRSGGYASTMPTGGSMGPAGPGEAPGVAGTSYKVPRGARYIGAEKETRDGKEVIIDRYAVPQRHVQQVEKLIEETKQVTVMENREIGRAHV